MSLSVCVSVFLCVCVSVCLSVCLSVSLSVCVSVFLCVCVSLCLYLCLSLFLLLQFWQNPKLLETLLATHPRTLVEAAPRDRLWGIGLGASNPKARNRSQWRGRNLLGEILTEVRAELRLKGRAVMDVPVPVSRN